MAYQTYSSQKMGRNSINKFRDFARCCGFENVTASPRCAQSNGEVERGVQMMKTILNKSDDEYVALLTYRNTPLHNGCSPAQLSMGRRLKTQVPMIHPEELIPRLPDLDLVRKREAISHDDGGELRSSTCCRRRNPTGSRRWSMDP